MAVAINKSGSYISNGLSLISLPQLLLRLGYKAFSVYEIIHKFNENKGCAFVGLPAAAGWRESSMSGLALRSMAESRHQLLNHAITYIRASPPAPDLSFLEAG
jgi:hypothetical protein